MSDQFDDIISLQKELKSVLSTIEGYSSTSKKSLEQISDLKITDTQSLLERCESIVNTNEQKPILRIIHHLACSGGTLISKTLAAQPNVFLLSELHPLTTLHKGNYKPKFLPSDVTTQARYASVPNVDLLAMKLFRANISMASEHISKYGGKLVIRDHTHSDYCVGEGMVNESVVADILKDDFELKRVVTLRDPIDAYLSLIKNKWLHFEPKSFDEYCKRVWFFCQEYRDDQIFRYEDFVEEPVAVLESIANFLDLEFDEDFSDIFDIFKVTGDSGRSSDEIGPRERQELDDEFKFEISTSEYYKLISKRFNYK